MGRKPKRSPQQLDGLLILDKPSGPTSAGCLNEIKHKLKQYKIGHAGTLDPLATGVLLVLLGHGTKLASYLTGREKTYRGRLRLGLTTDTYDSQGETTSEAEVKATPQEVRNQIVAWKDLTEQEVPAYSAAKHNGKALYSLARAGQDVPVKTKTIALSNVEVLDIELPMAEFRITCSAGTYVRSLVHSLGKRLGCGAILTELTRESSHPFGLDAAHRLEDVLNEPERFPEKVIPLSEALPHWPKFCLTGPLSGLVRNGAWLPVNEQAGEALSGKPGDRAIFKSEDGVPLALVEAKMKDDQLRWAILRGLWNKQASADADRNPASK